MNHKATFDQDGFVSVPRFCDVAELQALEAALARFIAERVPALPVEHVFYEDKANLGTLKQIQRMHEHDDFFGEFFEGKPKRLAEEILGEKVVGKNLQYFNKPPALGLATPPHQDGFYFMLEPCRALTMWMALDVVDEENGCVRYVRAIHTRAGCARTDARRRSAFRRASPTSAKRRMRETMRWRAPRSPGDLLAHHGLTIHRADANASATRTRRALGFIFYGESAREDLAAHKAYQAKLATEMEVAGKI